MIVKNTISGIRQFNHQGCLCPKCYRHYNFGNIKVSYELELNNSDAASFINIQNHLILGNVGEQNEHTLINVSCPQCNTKMIFIDNELRATLSELNKAHIYTYASCDGLEDYSGYVSFQNGWYYMALLAMGQFSSKFKYTKDSYKQHLWRYTSMLDNGIQIANDISYLQLDPTDENCPYKYSGGIYAYPISINSCDNPFDVTNSLKQDCLHFMHNFIRIKDQLFSDNLNYINNPEGEIELFGMVYSRKVLIPKLKEFFTIMDKITLEGALKMEIETPEYIEKKF